MNQLSRPRLNVLIVYALFGCFVALGTYVYIGWSIHRHPTVAYQPVVLFNDDFNSLPSGGQLPASSGWHLVPDDPRIKHVATWYGAVGHLYHEPHLPADYVDDPAGYLESLLVNGNAKWRDYMLKTRVEPMDDNGIGVVFRYQDPSHYYRFEMVSDPALHGPYVVFQKKDGGQVTELAKINRGNQFHGQYATGTWYRIKVVVQGENFQAFVDDQPVLSAHDPSFATGSAGLFTWQQSAAFFDDILVSQVGT